MKVSVAKPNIDAVLEDRGWYQDDTHLMLDRG